MSNCKSCGAQSSRCGCNSTPYRNPSYQGCGQEHTHGQVHNHYYGEKPESVHPAPCDDSPEECGPIWDVSGAARPLTYGTIQARDGCGDIKPYAWVLVTYEGTSTKAPIWSDPSKHDDALLINPAQTNYNGQIEIYSAGGPLEITIFCDDNGKPGTEVIEHRIWNGGYVDADFRVDTLPIQECPKDVGKPLIKINDGDKCNIPAIFMEPKYLKIMLNIANNEVAGLYDDVKAYFECLGIPFVDGTKVTGSCDECPVIYIYDGENCDQECPPDPCDAVFVDNKSPCWTRCAASTICDQKVDQTTEATHALMCDDGTLVQRPLQGFIKKIPLTVIAEDLSESLHVETDMPLSLSVAVPGAIPVGYSGLILRCYYEIDNEAGTQATGKISLVINGEVIGSTESGGAQLPNDSLFNGDFFVQPNGDPSVIDIDMSKNFNTGVGIADMVFSYKISVVGCF